MSTLLHIVHPYTYKIKPDEGIIVGDIAQFAERNQRVMDIVALAQETEYDLLVHNELTTSAFDMMAKTGCLLMDARFRPLLHLPQVCTRSNGEPLPPTRPDAVTDEAWTILNKFVTSHATYMERIGYAGRHVFIGGMYEQCVTAAAVHCKKFTGAPVSIVKDLCAIWDPADIPESEAYAQAYGVRVIRPEDL